MLVSILIKCCSYTCPFSCYFSLNSVVFLFGSPLERGSLRGMWPLRPEEIVKYTLQMERFGANL